mgnify:FL=1
MKKVLLVLLVVAGLYSCERDVIVIVEDDCDNCRGAKVSLVPQPQSRVQQRSDVNRGTLYAWIKDITVVATDDQGVDYGQDFDLVDDNSGADEFLLEDVPTGQIIDFSASSTSVTNDHNGQSLVGDTDPNNLDSFVNLMPYAEYATDFPTSQYIDNGDNLVYLEMNTDHGRLISSFQLASDIQYNNDQGVAQYKLVVNRGGSSATATGDLGVVSYWNGSTSVDSQEQTFSIELQNFTTGEVVYTRTITEAIVASTSTTNKYVVGLDFVDSSTVEVIFSWQIWDEEDGVDETASCGPTTTMNISGSYSLTGDETFDASDLVISGDLNLNGHTLNVPCGSITVTGNLNGGGSVNYCTNLTVVGNTQNNPTITNDCN